MARWREDIVQPDGTARRSLRSAVLGPVSELPTRRDARKILDRILHPLNQGKRRPEASVTFGSFVSEKFEPIAMPTFKFSTQQGYHSILRKHLVPQFGNQRLGEFNRSEIQRFILGKSSLDIPGKWPIGFTIC